MPLYEYKCGQCGQVFEMLRRMSDADRDLICPRCQSDEIERLLSAFAQSVRSGGCGTGPGRRFT